MKPGEKYRIITWTKRPPHWNSMGEMDKWQGKIVTIHSCHHSSVFIKEDIGSRNSLPNSCWSWNETDFIPVDFKDEDPNLAFIRRKL